MRSTYDLAYVGEQVFEYRIKIAPTKFELGVTSCAAHVGDISTNFGTLTNHI